MASLFRLLSRATTKLQALFKKQYIFNKHNTYLQEFAYKGPFKTSIFPVEKLGQDHSRTQSPSYARSTERDKGLWPNPYQTGI